MSFTCPDLWYPDVIRKGIAAAERKFRRKNYRRSPRNNTNRNTSPHRRSIEVALDVQNASPQLQSILANVNHRDTQDILSPSQQLLEASIGILQPISSSARLSDNIDVILSQTSFEPSHVTEPETASPLSSQTFRTNFSATSVYQPSPELLADVFSSNQLPQQNLTILNEETGNQVVEFLDPVIEATAGFINVAEDNYAAYDDNDESVSTTSVTSFGALADRRVLEEKLNTYYKPNGYANFDIRSNSEFNRFCQSINSAKMVISLLTKWNWDAANTSFRVLLSSHCIYANCLGLQVPFDNLREVEIDVLLGLEEKLRQQFQNDPGSIAAAFHSSKIRSVISRFLMQIYIVQDSAEFYYRQIVVKLLCCRFLQNAFNLEPITSVYSIDQVAYRILQRKAENKESASFYNEPTNIDLESLRDQLGLDSQPRFAHTLPIFESVNNGLVRPESQEHNYLDWPHSIVGVGASGKGTGLHLSRLHRRKLVNLMYVQLQKFGPECLIWILEYIHLDIDTVADLLKNGIETHQEDGLDRYVQLSNLDRFVNAIKQNANYIQFSSRHILSCELVGLDLIIREPLLMIANPYAGGSLVTINGRKYVLGKRIRQAEIQSHDFDQPPVDISYEQISQASSPVLEQHISDPNRQPIDWEVVYNEQSLLHFDSTSTQERMDEYTKKLDAYLDEWLNGDWDTTLVNRKLDSQPHQERCVRVMREHDATLLNHSTGSGKTVTASMIISDFLRQYDLLSDKDKTTICPPTVLVITKSGVLLNNIRSEMSEKLLNVQGGETKHVAFIGDSELMNLMYGVYETNGKNPSPFLARNERILHALQQNFSDMLQVKSNVLQDRLRLVPEDQDAADDLLKCGRAKSVFNMNLEPWERQAMNILVIVDEAHNFIADKRNVDELHLQVNYDTRKRFKIRNSKNFQSTAEVCDYSKDENFRRVSLDRFTQLYRIVQSCRKRIFLTATPFRNRPFDIASFYQLMYLDKFAVFKQSQIPKNLSIDSNNSNTFVQFASELYQHVLCDNTSEISSDALQGLVQAFAKWYSKHVATLYKKPVLVDRPFMPNVNTSTKQIVFIQTSHNDIDQADDSGSSQVIQNSKGDPFWENVYGPKNIYRITGLGKTFFELYLGDKSYDYYNALKIQAHDYPSSNYYDFPEDQYYVNSPVHPNSIYKLIPIPDDNAYKRLCGSITAADKSTKTVYAINRMTCNTTSFQFETVSHKPTAGMPTRSRRNIELSNNIASPSVPDAGKYNPKLEYIIDQLYNPKFSDRQGKTMIYSALVMHGLRYIERCLNHYNSTQRSRKYEIICLHASDANRFKLQAQYNNYVDCRDRVIVILSPASQEGLNFKTTRNLFIYEPQWNESIMKQIIGRAIRYKSHSELKNEEDRHVQVECLVLDRPVSTKQRLYTENSLDDQALQQEPIIDIDLLYNFLLFKKRLIDPWLDKSEHIENNTRDIALTNQKVCVPINQQDRFEPSSIRNNVSRDAPSSQSISAPRADVFFSKPSRRRKNAQTPVPLHNQFRRTTRSHAANLEPVHSYGLRNRRH